LLTLVISQESSLVVWVLGGWIDDVELEELDSSNVSGDDPLSVFITATCCLGRLRCASRWRAAPGRVSIKSSNIFLPHFCKYYQKFRNSTLGSKLTYTDPVNSYMIPRDSLIWKVFIEN
jgi:hypothetical protein